MIVLVSNDLIFAGPIRSAAQAIGHSLKISPRLAEPWQGELPDAVVLDLAGSKSTPEDVARVAREISPTVRLLAFAPHVQVDAIHQAEQAGFHKVLTRGQMSRDPRGVLEHLLSANEDA